MNIALKLLQLMLLLLPVIFYTGSRDSFLIKETLLVILSFSAFFVLLINIIEKRIEFRPDKTAYALIVFIFIELLSAINAKFTGLVSFTVIVHLCFLFAYLLSKHFSDSGESFLDIILAAGFFVSIYGVLQGFNLDVFKWNEIYPGRPSSSFGNPNFFAGYLIILIPLLLSSGFSVKNKLKKCLFICLSILFLTNLFLTHTRGAWIAGLCSLIYLFFVSKFNNKKIISTGLIFTSFILIFAFKTALSGYFNNEFNPEIPSVTERIFKWKTALEMARAHPFLGVGAGNLKVNYAIYQAKTRKTSPLQLKGTSESNVHNEYLQVWAETGTLGLISFLLIFIFYFTEVFKRFKTGRNTGSAAISAGVFAFLVFSLSNFPLRIIPTSFTLFFLMGLSFPDTGQKEIKSSKSLRFNLLSRIIFFTTYTIIIWKFAIIPFVADINRSKAYAYLRSNETSNAILLFEKAIKLDKIHSERTAFDLGEVYRKAGMYDKAIRAYNVSVALRNYGEVYNCIANCYWLQNNTEMALKNWQIAAELGMPQPNDQIIVENNINAAIKKLNH